MMDDYTRNYEMRMAVSGLRGRIEGLQEGTKSWGEQIPTERVQLALQTILKDVDTLEKLIFHKELG